MEDHELGNVANSTVVEKAEKAENVQFTVESFIKELSNDDTGKYANMTQP